MNLTKLQDAEPSDQSLIYADVVTCSSKVNMVMDDDRVEYAEVERTVTGEPLTKTASDKESGECSLVSLLLQWCFSILFS